MNLNPTTIGRYKVLGELGRGAMGVVYLGEDPLLKRGVAIKVVRGDEAAQGDARERFQMEAEISARLAHPGIVTIFDVGEEPGLGTFIAMEHVDGKSIADELAQGPMPMERVALLMVQGLHALEAAHGVGIIHRDVKPENFMVSKAGQIKLMDFGIAKTTDAFKTTANMMCTPAFAAPELLDNQRPSKATDRWAFAATLFNCVTGKQPFVAPSLSGLLNQILHEAPAMPADMAPPLAAVFLRAFEKNVEDRYPDLHTFYRAFLDAAPIGTKIREQCLAFLDTPQASSLSATAVLAFARKGLRHARPRNTKRRVGTAALALLLLLLAGLWWGNVILPRRLSVTSSPGGADLFIDDTLIGTTPIQNVKIPRGARSLRLDKRGYASLVHSLRNEDRNLDLTLVIAPWSQFLKSEPAGAEVLLNGVSKGVTPLTLQVPGEGTHKLVLRKEGCEPWSMTISRDRRPPAQIILAQASPGKNKPGFWKNLKQSTKKWFGKK